MRKFQGFSLVEMILVIVVLSVISAMASRLLNVGFSAYLAGTNAISSNWQGRIAVEKMVRDFRAIYSSTGITTAGAANITFIDTNNTTITYQISGTNLMRNSQVMADGVSSLSFNYYDANGAATTTPNSVVFIVFTLAVTQNKANYTITTGAYVRNIT